MAENILQNLTESQKKAVTHSTGPLLIVAGAGSGKTEVLTKRFAYLVAQGIHPQNILALTFTEKAAAEMLERIDKLIPYFAEELYVSTFHSFCDNVLREFGLEIGLDTGYKIVTEADAWILLRKNLFKLPLSYFRPMNNPTKFLGAFLKFISRAKDELILPKEYKNYAERMTETANTEEEKIEAQKQLELANVYEAYENLLKENSALDFGNLIIFTNQLLQTRPNIRQELSEKFKYILIDEYQDTNFGQNEVLKLLAKDHQNITVVGDDDQAIYRFRGASVQNILAFTENYPTAEKVVLAENFRTKQEILDKSYNLIQNNNPDRLEARLGISKKLKAMRGKGAVLELIPSENSESEIEQVIAKIKNVLNSTPEISYGDIAILARTNAALDNFAKALAEHDLPYKYSAGRGLFLQEEVGNVVAFLRFILDSSDSINLFRILSGSYWQIDHQDLVKLLAEARSLRLPLFEIIKEPQSAISADSKLGITKFLKIYDEAISAIPKSSTVQIIHDFAMNSGLIKSLTLEETQRSFLNVQNLNLFLRLAQNFESQSGEKLLPAFMDYLELMFSAQEDAASASPEDIDVITLSTVHSAKGREFRAVFMANLSSEHFPAKRKSDSIEIPDELIKEKLPEGDTHLQEERRLFYVGMTRAKDFLFLSYAKNFGGLKNYKPSVFLTEIFAEKEFEKKAEIEQLLPIGTSKNETFDFLANLKSLSFSALSAFTQCPLKFKCKYIWGMQEPPSAAITFGNNIHNTLRYFCEDWKRGNFKTLDEMLSIYERVWRREGFLDTVQEEEYKQAGREWLKNYYEIELLHQKEPPIYIEKGFALENFDLPLRGKIDRIDKTKEGWVILDYKTGEEKEEDDKQSALQLAIYALATKAIAGELPNRVAFVYLKTGAIIPKTFTEKDLEEVSESIADSIQQIKKGEFPPKKNYFCTNCPYRPLCPLWNV